MRQKPRTHDKTKKTLQMIMLFYWRRDEFLKINQKDRASITTKSKYGTTVFLKFQINLMNRDF